MDSPWLRSSSTTAGSPSYAAWWSGVSHSNTQGAGVGSAGMSASSGTDITGGLEVVPPTADVVVAVGTIGMGVFAGVSVDVGVGRGAGAAVGIAEMVASNLASTVASMSGVDVAIEVLVGTR